MSQQEFKPYCVAKVPWDEVKGHDLTKGLSYDTVPDTNIPTTLDERMKALTETNVGVVLQGNHTPQEFLYTNIDTLPYKWNKPVLTYCLYNETGDIPNNHMQHVALNYALTHMGLYINTKFKRIPVSQQQEADLVYQFTSTDPYFTSPSILAYTWMPNPQNPKSGWVTFNDDPKLLWSLDGKGVNSWKIDPVHYKVGDPTMFQTINLIEVMMHESEHAMGLPHIMDDNTCIIQPYYQNKYDFCAKEITNLQQLYGARHLESSLIEHVMDSLRRVFPNV